MLKLMLKSGFVTIVGRSNVGKSTLINTLVNTKVAIVTPKPQTTRRPVRGIVSEVRGQIVFVDTPGYFLGKNDALSQRLNTFVNEQLEGIDAVVYVVDPTRPFGAEEEHIQRKLRTLTIPIVMIVNKIDLAIVDRPSTAQALTIDVGQRTTIVLSALRGTEKVHLLNTLFDLLPVGEPFYAVEQKTDMSLKDWLAELIREKAFLALHDEVPYAVNVEVETFEKRPDNKLFAAATLFTTEERYKKMIIGAGGKTIKNIGSAARREWELATDRKIFLQIQVEVDPDWPRRFARGS